MADRIDAMAAPIEPFAGFVMEGGNGLVASGEEGFAVGGLAGAVGTLAG